MRAFKTIQLYKVPSILILHMKKLKSGGYMSYMSSQNHHYVSFPLEGLDMTEYIINKDPISAYNIRTPEFVEEGNMINAEAGKGIFGTTNGSAMEQEPATIKRGKLVYDCYGVVNHYGNSYFGHYTAYIKK